VNHTDTGKEKILDFGTIGSMKLFGEHGGHGGFSALIFHGLSVKNTRVLFPSKVKTGFFHPTV
jgi:hypothetical protein